MHFTDGNGSPDYVSELVAQQKKKNAGQIYFQWVSNKM